MVCPIRCGNRHAFGLMGEDNENNGAMYEADDYVRTLKF